MREGHLRARLPLLRGAGRLPPATRHAVPTGRDSGPRPDLPPHVQRVHRHLSVHFGVHSRPKDAEKFDSAFCERNFKTNKETMKRSWAHMLFISVHSCIFACKVLTVFQTIPCVPLCSRITKNVE